MKSFWNFLKKNKLYGAINLVGLTVSMAFVLLLAAYIQRQLSTDSFQKNADRIYVVASEQRVHMGYWLDKHLKNNFPEIEKGCCVGNIASASAFTIGGELVYGSSMAADSTFFEIFSYDLVEGNKADWRVSWDRCMVSREFANAHFGDKDPLGQVITFNNNGDYPLTVCGVYEDFGNSILKAPDVLMRGEIMTKINSANDEEMSNAGSGICFVMTYPGADLQAKHDDVLDWLKENFWVYKRQYEEVRFIPLREMYFLEDGNRDGTGTIQFGNRSFVNLLLAMCILLLAFAVLNYINMTTALTGFRAKEMATRKLFGSSQNDISLKLIAESTLMVAISFAIGLVLAFAFQDEAVELFKGKINLYGDISLGTVSVCIAFILLLGIISGIMPSWQLSHFQPIDIVKGSFRYHSKMVLGKIFIILQNVVTVVMLTSALVIWLQLNHLIHAPLGYNTEHLFVINAPDGKHQTVRNLLEKMPFVEKIGMFEKTSLATGSCSMQSVTRNDKLVILYLLDLDKTAYNLYGFKKKKDYGQTSDGYYLTEETMRQMEYTDTTTQTVWNKPIAGVLNDIHRINVLQGVGPFVIQIKDSFNYPSYLVKTNGDKQAKAAFTAMLKEQGVPEADLEWSVQSLEESIAETFADQRNTLKIISLFTIIAIVISILGYIGMSLFFIRQRQKEIAIRKVMGSTSREVLLLMLRTFSIPMLISFVIAVPISWYFMRDWLSNFSYRIALSPWIFAAAGFTCFIISVLTVIIQSWRAASENPINNIKTE